MMGTPILEDENMMQIGIMSKNLENVLRERSKTIKASWNSANMVSKNLLSEIILISPHSNTTGKLCYKDIICYKE